MKRAGLGRNEGIVNRLLRRLGREVPLDERSPNPGAAGLEKQTVAVAAKSRKLVKLGLAAAIGIGSVEGGCGRGREKAVVLCVDP